MQVNRAKVNEVFVREIEALYGEFSKSSELVQSFEFKGLVKKLRKLRLTEFQGLLGYWRRKSRSSKSSEFGVSSSELNLTSKKLNLARFKGFLGYWRHQSRSSNLDIPFIGREDDLLTPNSCQIPFVERTEDL
jgi:uncharacterized membrane protein (UPF0136 family)